MHRLDHGVLPHQEKGSYIRGHMVDLVSAFIGFSASVSTMAAPVCSPTKSGATFSFPHIITRIWCQLFVGSQPQLVYPQTQLLYIRLREHPGWGARKIIRATGSRCLVSEYLLDTTVMLSPQNLSIVATSTRLEWRHPQLTWWRKPLKGLTPGWRATGNWCGWEREKPFSSERRLLKSKWSA